MAKFFNIIILTFLLIGCKTPKNTISKLKVNSITLGSSFGKCVGYCTKLNNFTSSQLIIQESSRDEKSYPIKIEKFELSNDEWDQLVEELNAIDFKQLPEKIGCPDCADGGSEFIEIIYSDFTSKRVDFEFGTEVKELGGLLPALRKLKLEITKEE